MIDLPATMSNLTKHALSTASWCVVSGIDSDHAMYLVVRCDDGQLEAVVARPTDDFARVADMVRAGTEDRPSIGVRALKQALARTPSMLISDVVRFLHVQPPTSSGMPHMLSVEGPSSMVILSPDHADLHAATGTMHDDDLRNLVVTTRARAA